MTEGEFYRWYAGIGVVTAVVLFFTREEDLRPETNFGRRACTGLRWPDHSGHGY